MEAADVVNPLSDFVAAMRKSSITGKIAPSPHVTASRQRHSARLARHSMHAPFHGATIAVLG